MTIQPKDLIPLFIIFVPILFLVLYIVFKIMSDKNWNKRHTYTIVGERVPVYWDPNPNEDQKFIRDHLNSGSQWKIFHTVTYLKVTGEKELWIDESQCNQVDWIQYTVSKITPLIDGDGNTIDGSIMDAQAVFTINGKITFGYMSAGNVWINMAHVEPAYKRTKK